MSEIVRLYSYKDLFAGRRAVGKAEIMAKLEISEATFKRDIAKLRDQLVLGWHTIACAQAAVLDFAGDVVLHLSEQGHGLARQGLGPAGGVVSLIGEGRCSAGHEGIFKAQ